MSVSSAEDPPDVDGELPGVGAALSDTAFMGSSSLFYHGACRVRPIPDADASRTRLGSPQAIRAGILQHPKTKVRTA